MTPHARIHPINRGEILTSFPRFNRHRGGLGHTVTLKPYYFFLVTNQSLYYILTVLGVHHRSDKTGLPLWMLGFGADRLRGDMNRLLSLLFHEGVLDEQFLQLQALQDESSPNFVSEVLSIYFHESEELLKNLRALLRDREFSDYKKMGNHVNQFMGSSSSIGANRVRNVCVAFRVASEHHSRPGCLRALEMLEQEYCYLKNKLHELFQMEQQRVLAAGVRYPAQN